jgi:hypothetical protein
MLFLYGDATDTVFQKNIFGKTNGTTFWDDILAFCEDVVTLGCKIKENEMKMKEQRIFVVVFFC